MTVPRRLEDLLRDLLTEVCAVDAADTAAVLMVAWRGFSAANAAGQLLAESTPSLAAFSNPMQPLVARIGAALRAAPSMPADLQPVMVNLACPAGDRFEEQRARMICGLIRDVMLALDTLLPRAALHAPDATDHAACREGSRVSRELAELL
jgi:hypothetical protein